MSALDRLDWAAGISLSAFGVRLGVRVNDAALLPRVQEHLPPSWQPSGEDVVEYLYSIRGAGRVPGSNVRRFALVYSGAAQVARTLNEGDAFEAFESAVRLDVASSSARWVFVHAGVVGWKRRAIVLPAPSMHGKSRLVDALVRAGATYYSDEFAIFDTEGRIHPYAKSLDLRVSEGPTRRIPTASLARVGSRPLRVGLIVSTRYEAGRVWRPRHATPGEALLMLLSNTVRARAAPAYSLKTLGRVVEGARTLEGPRGDAEQVARALLDAVESVGV